MSSIGPIGNIPSYGGGYTPQQMEFLQQEFTNYYNAFLSDPSSQNAQNLESFLKQNQSALQYLCQNFINLKPFPNANFTNLFNSVMTDLQSYNPSNPSPALFEFLGDMASWAGVNQSPSQTYQAEQEALQAAMSYLAEGKELPYPLEMMLSMIFQNQGFGSQGFYQALLAEAPDKVAFANAYQQASSLYQEYLADPTSANGQALLAGLQKMESLL